MTKIFISAGEPSADRIGANLMRAISRLDRETSFVGLGGERMLDRGLDRIVDLTGQSAMWFLQSVALIPRMYLLLRKCRQVLDETRPDAVVVIDYPGFHFYLAREARRRGIPSIYYVTPQLWAYNPYRIVKMRKIVDHALVILPFEEEYFRRRGIPADFVGHPLMDDLQEKYGRDLPPPPPEEPAVLGLLPGSRRQEIVSTLPHTIRAIRQIRAGGETFRIVASAARPEFRPMLEEALGPLGIPFEILERKTGEIFRQSRLALVTSGTTSLEGIFHGTPMVVIYRIPALSYLAAQPWRLLPHIALPNILAGEEIVPEFLLWRGGDTRFSDAAVRAFGDREVRAEMRRRVLGVRSTLVDRPDASEAAARRVLELTRAAC